MAMNDYATHNIDAACPELGKIFSQECVSSETKYMEVMRSAMEVLTRVDLELAYSSEKLVNLETLLIHLLAWENDYEAMSAEYENISVDFIQNTLVFDLLFGVLDSEVRELDNFMCTLEALIVDARYKIYSCKHLRELFTVMESKLQDSEESLKQSQEQVLEMKMQLAKLQRTSLVLSHNDWKYDVDMTLLDDLPLTNIDSKLKLQNVDQRHILRMLEKSLTRELDLEKKLTLLKQNEEDIKLKLHLTEQVAICMEEAAEVVWGRFLEAENASEVLMGISKELVGQLQIIQFNLNGSIQRENDLKHKLQDCIEQLKAKETAIQKLDKSMAQHIIDNSEVCALREKVKLLEEQLKKSESELKNVNASSEACQEQIDEMDSIIESLKENIYVAESRAESAEAKITQLTETNLELTEELGFLKGNNDSNTKKMSLLENQVRELELQLQHARASSEASQEQQNMLYSAIWDMETLIDELKQKVSKAESKTDNAGEQCIILTETNLELNKELDFLRARMECLEMSLNQANDEKITNSKDINMKTNLIMDMVMQLTMERERIQKQLYSLTEENKILMKKLQKTKDTSAGMHDNEDSDGKDFPSSRLDSANSTSIESSKEVVVESSTKSLQVEELSKHALAFGTEVGSSISASDATNLALKHEAESLVEAGWPSQVYVFMAVLVLLLSVLVTYLCNQKLSLLDIIDG